MSTQIPENEGLRATSCGSLARKFKVSLDAVLDAARCNGIGVVDGTTKVPAMQIPRLLKALGGDLAPRMPSGGIGIEFELSPEQHTCNFDFPSTLNFSWNRKKNSLQARLIVQNHDAMLAVERLAVARDAVTWVSKRKNLTALCVTLGAVVVVIGRDRLHGRPGFVVTAFARDLPTPGDHATLLINAAANVKEVVSIEERLSILPSENA